MSHGSQTTGAVNDDTARQRTSLVLTPRSSSRARNPCDLQLAPCTAAHSVFLSSPRIEAQMQTAGSETGKGTHRDKSRERGSVEGAGSKTGKRTRRDHNRKQESVEGRSGRVGEDSWSTSSLDLSLLSRAKRFLLRWARSGCGFCPFFLRKKLFGRLVRGRGTNHHTTVAPGS